MIYDPTENLEECIEKFSMNDKSKEFMLENIDALYDLFYTIDEFKQFSIYMDRIFTLSVDDVINSLKTKIKHTDRDIIENIIRHDDIDDMIGYYLQVSMPLDEILIAMDGYNIDIIVNQLMIASASTYYHTLYNKVFSMDYELYCSFKDNQFYISELYGSESTDQ